MEPTFIEYQELKAITDNFDEKRKLGEGGYGTVYWGFRENGDEIAVKVLRDNVVLDDNLFQNEFGNLTKLKHDNIVQLVGFCYESKGDIITHEGKKVVAERQHRALCFEYMHNGSLRKHISDKCDSLNWHTSYKIIKGTCEGLKYLHGGSKPIYHLDLKPDNILLDKNMVAKLADFGLSKIFYDRQTKIVQNAIGTRGYMPPEFIEQNIVSDKNDIFSLGVIIIEIVLGPTAYSKLKLMEMSSQELIDLAQEKWRRELQSTWSGSLLEEYCRQVKICTEISLECVNGDRRKRPPIAAVIKRLNEAEPAIDKEILVPTYGLTAHKTLGIVSQPVVKIGIWGGNEGIYYDPSVMPQRLLTVTIRSGEAIDSIVFSYIGVDLKEHVAGPWGGPYGEKPRKIVFGPDEIIKKIYGTHADYKTERDVIRSLNIVTNVKEYSFGQAEGNTFRILVENNSHIVGFYARSKGWLLNAIGIYIHP
ncbi:unnamed protein product [Urochloa humidicola]